MADDTQQQPKDEGKAKKWSCWFKLLHPSEYHEELAREWYKNCKIIVTQRSQIEALSREAWNLIVNRMLYYSIERFNKVTTCLSIILALLTAAMLAASLRMIGVF